MSTTLTLFLAAVAFLYVVGEALPKISYLTLLDKAMLVAFAAIFLSGFESFLSYVLHKNGIGSKRLRAASRHNHPHSLTQGVCHVKTLPRLAPTTRFKCAALCIAR